MMNKAVLALIGLFAGTTQAVMSAPLEVTVTGVKAQTGEIRVAIFDSADSFQKKPARTLVLSVDAENIQFSVDDLPAGEFAIMLFHDLDSNEKMKTNLVGMPREPWGASLEGTRLFGPPKWKDVVFAHTDSGTSMNIELH